MKNNKFWKRAVSMFLVVALATPMFGCADKEAEETAVTIEPMEIEEVAKYSFDVIGGSDVMPIFGFYGPVPGEISWDANSLPDYYTDEYFKMFKEVGVNIIGPSMMNYDSVPQYNIKALDLCEKWGLGMLVKDGRILSNDVTVQEVDAYINDYANHPAFAGVYMIDEPGAVYFRDHENGTNIDEFKTISKNINELGYFFYGNLLGMQGNTTYTESDVEAYQRYVREWVDTCDPKAIFYDRYIFGNNNGLDMAETYFKTMETVRSVAEESNRPFWVFVEAGNQWNDKTSRFDSNGYYPSQGEFYWNLGTLLAFGAKGVLYFPLLQPSYYAYAESELFDFQRNGLIGAWGNKTRWYHYAKAMNAQIAAVDEVLMNSVNKGVIASGKDAKEDLSDCKYLMEGTSFRELAGVSGDAMIGCFNYEGKTALYVVNYDTEYAQKIKLDFAGKYNVTVTQDAETKHVSGSSLELTLAAGNSALVVFE